MSADIVDIANVLDRRATAIERKIHSLRKEQKKRLSSIRELEQARDAWRAMIRDQVAKRAGKLSAATLSRLSGEGIEYERNLGEVCRNIALLRREVERLGVERRAQCDVLVRHKRKAMLMRNEAAKNKRKAARRKFARDAVGPGAVTPR